MPFAGAYTIHNARVVLADRVIDGGAVRVEEGRIVAVEEGAPRGDLPMIDARGRYLGPGFVELHIHGCGEVGFESPEPDALRTAEEFLLRRGVTTFLPTLQCDLAAIERLGAAIRADEASRAAGLYVEGPFISLEKRGGILPETIRPARESELDRVNVAAGGTLRLMTVAPELEGAETIARRLAELGVIPCWGHSNCRLAQVPRLDGVRCNLTHLFNGMSGISHKEAGLAMLPFLDQELFFELNGDGVHLNQEALRMARAHLNPERMILISDAVISAGSGYGRYRYFGRPVVSGADGVRYEEGGTLIGSNCLIPEVVRRFVELTGAPLHEAVRAATLTPCELLGIDDRRGSIAAGKEADLVLFDDELRVSEVFLGDGGHLIEEGTR